jgi:hypothetical protein
MTWISFKNASLTVLILSQPWLGAQAADKQIRHKVVSSHTEIQNFINEQEPELYGCDSALQKKWHDAMGKPTTAVPIDLPLTSAPRVNRYTKAIDEPGDDVHSFTSGRTNSLYGVDTPIMSPTEGPPMKQSGPVPRWPIPIPKNRRATISPSHKLMVPSAKDPRPSSFNDQSNQPNRRPSHAEIHQFTQGYRDKLHGVDTPEPSLNDSDAPIIIPPHGPVRGLTNLQLFRHDIRWQTQEQRKKPLKKNPE